MALTFTVADTYSWFNNNEDGYGEVIAASRKDILTDVKIDYKGDVPILKLKKAPDIDYSPVIFFSIEGDVKDYILHMDSVKLRDEVEIPIVPNVNLPQVLNLIIGGEKEVVGNIRVKHLNEFIDEPMEFKLSQDYLLNRYFLNKGVRSYGSNNLSNEEKDELIDLVKDTLLYTERYLTWEPLSWEESGNRIEKAYISEKQAQLIDIIAPNLLDYNERLYQLLNIITKDLEDEMEKNNILSKENEELLSRIAALEEENMQLNTYILDLEEKIHKLTTGPAISPENPELPVPNPEVPQPPVPEENPEESEDLKTPEGEDEELKPQDPQTIEEVDTLLE